MRGFSPSVLGFGVLGFRVWVLGLWGEREVAGGSFLIFEALVFRIHCFKLQGCRGFGNLALYMEVTGGELRKTERSSKTVLKALLETSLLAPGPLS